MYLLLFVNIFCPIFQRAIIIRRVMIKKLSIAMASVFAFAFFSLLSVSAQTTAAPTLTILSPQEGEEVVGQEVTVQISVPDTEFTFTNYATSPADKGNEGHAHIWLDETNFAAGTATKYIDPTEPLVLSSLQPGAHTVTVELVKNDHTSYSPAVRKTVSFTVASPEVMPLETTMYMYDTGSAAPSTASKSSGQHATYLDMIMTNPFFENDQSMLVFLGSLAVTSLLIGFLLGHERAKDKTKRPVKSPRKKKS